METQHKVFLDNLRESGEVNMFGAVPHLQRAFLIEKDEARLILKEWMEKRRKSTAHKIKSNLKLTLCKNNNQQHKKKPDNTPCILYTLRMWQHKTYTSALLAGSVWVFLLHTQ